MLWYLLASSLGVLYSDPRHSLKPWITKYKCQDVICHRQVKSTIMVFWIKLNSFNIESKKIVLSSTLYHRVWKDHRWIGNCCENGQSSWTHLQMVNRKPYGLWIRPSVISHWAVHMILKCHFVFVYTDSRYRLRHSGALRHIERPKP